MQYISSDEAVSTENIAIEPLDPTFLKQMLDRYGPVMPDHELSTLMGFKSAQTLRRSIAKGAIPLKVFQIGDKRGYFALTEEVAKLVWGARNSNKKLEEN